MRDFGLVGVPVWFAAQKFVHVQYWGGETGNRTSEKGQDLCSVRVLVNVSSNVVKLPLNMNVSCRIMRK